VRSTELDKWTHEQLRIMTVGGNDAARAFFSEKGWDAGSSAGAAGAASAQTDEKYTSRAAKLYRAHLARCLLYTSPSPRD
jgi:ADP-ribosylation factor GTPase-activating protein 2/3